MDALPLTLIDLLTNNIVLRETAPYLGIADIFALLRVNTSLRYLLLSQPEAWRYMNLDNVKAAKIDSSPIDSGGISWRAERMDEALTEDDFYAGPLRGIFNRLHQGYSHGNILKHLDQPNLLRYVQILVLDGLSVPADLVREIVCEDRFNVRVLSIRECKHLNLVKLQQVLRYACRPTRPANTPKLRALYVFGKKEPSSAPKTVTSGMAKTSLGMVMANGVTKVSGAQIGAHTASFLGSGDSDSILDGEKWYRASGRAIKRPQSDWPETLQVCRGIISFDAVLCRGVRHDITKVTSTDYLPASIATVALGFTGCEMCSSAPEGATRFTDSDVAALPLLSPPPTHTTNLRAAQLPSINNDYASRLSFFLRCEDCLRGRWCERCQRWWCETCYENPVPRQSQSAPVAAAAGVEDGDDDDELSMAAIESEALSQPSVKVFSRLCVEHCLVDEMMMSADGYWG